MLADFLHGLPSSPGGIAGLMVAVLVAAYIVVCHLLRFRGEKAILKRFPYPDRASMAKMTHAEAQQIYKHILTREFPYMTKTALQFGIFKTYGIADISRLLVATKSVTDPIKAGKRYEDTVIIFSEFSLNDPTSDRCLEAIARMNYLHSKYVTAGQISNADLLYTLAACITEPTRFIAAYEWRPLNDLERCALGVFWMSLGDAMGIEYAGYLAKGADRSWRDGIDFADDITAWALRYEIDAVRPDPINVTPSRRLTAMLLQLLPAPLQPFATEALTVLMGQRMRDAFLFPEPGIGVSFITYGLLIARRFALRHLMLPRFSDFRSTSEHPDPVTGRLQLHDYLVDPWYNPATTWTRWGPMALLTRLLGGHVPGDVRSEGLIGGKGGKGDGGGTNYMPSGFVVSDLGPFNTMGVGMDKVGIEVERLRTARSMGCPFA